MSDRHEPPDGLVEFAVSVAGLQLVMGGIFTALTIWLDRPFDGSREPAVALALCGSLTFFALAFLLRRNFGRLLQAGAYAIGTLALGAAAALALTDSLAGGLVVAGLTAISAVAARAYVSPEVRTWTT